MEVYCRCSRESIQHHVKVHVTHWWLESTSSEPHGFLLSMVGGGGRGLEASLLDAREEMNATDCPLQALSQCSARSQIPYLPIGPFTYQHVICKHVSSSEQACVAVCSTMTMTMTPNTGVLVTTFLNHRDNHSIPSLPLLEHCHFPLPPPRYTQLIHPSSPALGMRISALSSIP